MNESEVSKEILGKDNPDMGPVELSDAAEKAAKALRTAVTNMRAEQIFAENGINTES